MNRKLFCVVMLNGGLFKMLCLFFHCVSHQALLAHGFFLSFSDQFFFPELKSFVSVFLTELLIT